MKTPSTQHKRSPRAGAAESLPSRSGSDQAARREEMSRQLQAEVDRRRNRQRLARYAGRLAVVVGLIALWSYSSGRLIDEFWVSSPLAVAERLWQWLTDGTIWHHFVFTIRAMVFGLIIGTLVGIRLAVSFCTSCPMWDFRWHLRRWGCCGPWSSSWPPETTATSRSNRIDGAPAVAGRYAC